MPDENNQAETTDNADANRDDGNGGTNDNDPAKLAEALQKRIAERDETINTLKSRLDAIEAARKKQLENSGNYEQLLKEREAELESLRPSAERAKALEDAIRSDNDSRIEQVPEAKRTLIPSDYPPEKLKAWLTANWRMLTSDPAPNLDAGAGAGAAGGSAVRLTDEQRQMARRMGMSDEQYVEAMKKTGRL